MSKVSLIKNLLKTYLILLKESFQVRQFTQNGGVESTDKKHYLIARPLKNVIFYILL
jgi:hypothetical protein